MSNEYIDIVTKIKNKVISFLHHERNIIINDISIEKTESHFDGDFSIVVFSLAKEYKINPSELCNVIGEHLISNGYIKCFNVVKGYLNVVLHDKDVIDIINNIWCKNFIFNFPHKNKKILIEYSSPNTNKPLHLGHLRNIFLGFAIAKILQMVGYDVITVTLVNDRGIHICKSMLAYMRTGNGLTPESTHIKGDHFVGDFYVAFDKMLKHEKEVLKLHDDNLAPIMLEAQKILEQWEKKDPVVLSLWGKMNKWVLDGFAETYQKLNIRFDKTYYESQTYLLGKNIIEEGLHEGVFFKKEDGSVWVDLRQQNLNEKLLLRANGTSVYITQDIGTADIRYKEFKVKDMIYVVGDEQEHHFVVLKYILQKLNKPYANGIYHLSYGMINLPSGKMKSREGTVIDADDIIDMILEKAEEKLSEIGKINFFTDEAKKETCNIIGLAALRFFLLKISPKKTITFDINKSIDFSGDTGTFILYTNVRIHSIFMKCDIKIDQNTICKEQILTKIEKDLILTIFSVKTLLYKSAEKRDPSLLAQYALTLAKKFNSLYNNLHIINEKNNDTKIMRLIIAKTVSDVLENILGLFGIKIIKKM